MKTSLIILFKNEVEYVELTMSTAYAYFTQHDLNFEIVAVDDSTDGTWEFLQAFSSFHHNVRVVKGEEPSGYGKALKAGFSAATGDILIPFNGDLSDSFDDVRSYIDLIESGYDMVFGSRYMPGARVSGSVLMKEKVSLLSNKFLQLLFQIDCSDITNSFKAYKKSVIEDIDPESNGYHIGIEIALKAILKKYRYVTVPIKWTGRKHGRSKMSVIRVIPKYLYTAVKIRYSMSQKR